MQLTCEQEIEPYDDEDREPADSEAIEVIRGIIAHFRACTVDPWILMSNNAIRLESEGTTTCTVSI